MKQLVFISNAIVIVLSTILILFCDSTYNSSIQEFAILLPILPMLLYFQQNSSILALKGQYLRTSYIFVLGYVIVFFQFNIDLVCHNITSHSAQFSSPSVINKCLLYAVAGICSYFLGNCLALWKGFSISRKKTNRRIISSSFLKFQSILLFVFAIVYLYYNATEILSGNFIYSEDAMTEKAGSLSNYSSVMVYVMTFTYLVSRSFNIKSKGESVSIWGFIKGNGFLFNLSIALYLIFIFMTGDRGPIITIVLAHAITYVTISKKKLKLVAIIAFIAIGSVGLTAIGEVRRTANILTVSELLKHKSESDAQSISPMTAELAGSYNTFTYAVDKVPDKYDFFYGLMQIRESVYAVPFLYRIVPFVFSSKEYENSSTSYCTFLIQGLNRTYGNGSSLLADFYLDFGYIGILVGMFFLGVVIVRLDSELFLGSNIYWQVAAIVFFSHSLYISRATLTTPLYYIVPALLIMYLHKFFK